MLTKVESLSNVISKIVDKKILLPDFQRDFVWREEDRQAKLVASVLAKMPVGSILLLEVNVNDYAYRLIGCNERKTSVQLGVSGEVAALLDGQQRITVLANAFSDVIFDTAGRSSNLINEKGLKRRFFFRIPKYHSSEELEDFFGARKQYFPILNPAQDDPMFLSDEIYEAIKVVPFLASDTSCYNPFKFPKSSKSELVNYCSSGEEYLIPLFILNDSGNKTWLQSIIKRISENICMDIVSEYEALDSNGRFDYANKVLTKDILDLVLEPDKLNKKEVFEKELSKQGDSWVNSVIEYLNSCLNNIQLNQIIVDNHNRARAINIYENLNIGGVALGVFELILAKFASISTENYSSKILSNMKVPRVYDSIVYSDVLRNNTKIINYINSNKYTATNKMECISNNGKSIVKLYIDAYLNVISLISYASTYYKDDIKVECIKRNKILSIDPHLLDTNCKNVCDALDLALFFFQMRCGIRSITELNYSLMLVVVGYILSNESYRNKSTTYDYLEAWYWAVMFSGAFNSDQTERAIQHINMLIEVLNTNDTTPIKELKNKMFKAEYFSEKEFLTLKLSSSTGILPKKFLRDTVCQFFLSRTYKGLFDSNLEINAFNDKLMLEKHHVIPLGSFKGTSSKLLDLVDDIRKKQEFFLNSPVNFVYITKEENQLISDDKLDDYQQRINSHGTINTLGLYGNLDASTEEKCRDIISARFEHLVGAVETRMNTLIP